MKALTTMRYKLPVLALAAVFCTGAAFADNLNLGGNYNNMVIDESTLKPPQITVGGGTVGPSFLDGQPLPWVYCVGLFTNVGVPADYPDTTVTYDGTVNGSPINNAGEIAWLLDAFATQAETSVNDQEALQAAIWAVEYNGTGSSLHDAIVTGDAGAGYFAKYQSDLTALGSNTAGVGGIAWLNPGNGSATVYQALVTAVPEPASIFMLGTATLLAMGALRSKLRVRG